MKIFDVTGDSFRAEVENYDGAAPVVMKNGEARNRSEGVAGKRSVMDMLG